MSMENKEDICLRVACEEDAEALLDIYAPYVERTAVSFEYEVPSVEEFEERIRRISGRYPYLLAESEGEILGYAYASPSTRGGPIAGRRRRPSIFGATEGGRALEGSCTKPWRKSCRGRALRISTPASPARRRKIPI